MGSAAIPRDELLGAVAQACTVSQIHKILGERRCHRSTVWRALRRAEGLDLVEHTAAADVDVWELTETGRRTLAGHGDRPKCPSCGARAGSRRRADGDLVARGRLRCRACDAQWTPTALARDAAEDRDRSMPQRSPAELDGRGQLSLGVRL